MKNEMHVVSGSIGQTALLALVVLAAFCFAGCNKPGIATSQPPNTALQEDKDLSHGGWWCVEHGVPETECARCDKSLVAKFKDEGDWCKEHGRPESQCFLCSPKRFDKFAALYEAKTGHQPPKPTE